MSGGMIARAARAAWRALGAPFAWRNVRATPGWFYQENAVTGDRRAVHRGGGYSALDLGWVRDARGRGIVHGAFSSFDVKPRGIR